MDPLTLVMAASVLMLLGQRLQFTFSSPLDQFYVRILRVKAGMKAIGGLWWGIVGAPLAAWFLTVFFILPLMGVNGYTLNISTILAFANPTAVLIFLALWLAFTFGFFGMSAYKRNGKGLR